MQDSAAILFLGGPAADRQVRYYMANLAPLYIWPFSSFLAFPGPFQHAAAYYLTGWFGPNTAPVQAALVPAQSWKDGFYQDLQVVCLVTA